MKRYKFDIEVSTDRWQLYPSYCTYNLDVPTTMDELETLVLRGLVEDDPSCQDTRTHWKNLRESEGNNKEDLTQKIYQTIFGKMDTYYWQHDYAGIVFRLVRGLMETTGIDPSVEELNNRLISLPRNNPDGSGLDCGHRCHERATQLLSLAASKNYSGFKVEELK